MRRFVILGMVVLAVCLISGCLFDSNDDDVKKGSISGRVTMIVTGEPVAGVKVMLFNLNAKIDTTDVSENRTAFVDSAVTGEDGSYRIEGVKPGTYGVVPMPEVGESSYKYSMTQSITSNGITVKGDDLTLNFVAEKLNMPGAEESTFKYKIFIKKDSRYQINDICRQRKFWVCFVPYYGEGLLCPPRVSQSPKYSCYIYTDESYGYTAVFWTKDNYFKLVVNYETADSHVDKIKEFYYGFPLGSTPEYSEWELDMDAGTIIQTK